MKNKKYLKIVLIIVALLIVVILAVIYRQKNDIKAALICTQYTPNQIEAKINDNSKELSDELKKAAPGLIRDLTPEEKKMIAEGTVTTEDVFEKIIEERLQQDNANGSGGDKTSDKGTQINADDKNVDDTISKYISKMYSLKSNYLGQIGGLESQAKADYNAIPKDKRTISAKKNIISKYYSRAASLESQCDGEVNSVLVSLENDLKKQGADTSIVNKIRSSYENEKSLKKAYYLSLLK